MTTKNMTQLLGITKKLKIHITSTFCAVTALLLVGSLMRIYQYGAYPFGFDQVQLLENAERIISGSPTLIGPRTGPAPMFTGPLIYYLLAPLHLIISSEYSLVVMSILISLVTGMVLYRLSYRYLHVNMAIVLLALWALSPFVILMDRIPWNPLLLPLAAIMVFFPLLSTENKLDKFDILIVAAGILLGYQAHFSGLLLWPLATLLVCFKYLNRVSIITTSTLAFIASIIPTVIFDMRHNWLNYQGLVSLLSNKDNVSSFDILNRLAKTLYIAVETLGKIVFQGQNNWIVMAGGLGLLLLYLYISLIQNKNKSELLTVMTWIVFTIVSLSFYRGEKPEYYFLVLLPALLFVIAKITLRLLPKNILVAVLILMIINTSLFVMDRHSLDKGFNIAHQIDAKKHIELVASEYGVEEIVYDMAPIESLGMKYLVRDIGLSQGGSRVHVVYPFENESEIETVISSNAGIWIENNR